MSTRPQEPLIKGSDRNLAKFIQNGHGKFRQTPVYMYSKPLMPLSRSVIPYITL